MNKNNEKNNSDEEVITDIVPQRQALIKQTADIDGFIEKRQEFIQKVGAICVEGKDYHIIQGKKSLAKGGAEKIASIFQWNATFIKDHEAVEMLGQIVGLVAFKCTLCKGTKFVGEGRGAATLQKNNGDPNKTLKMAQKSAFIDAVLRASGLSDFFTQDLEDMTPSDISTPPAQNFTPQAKTGSYPPSEKQMETIKKNMEEKSVTEEMIIADGFPALKDLTGGREGTASELIGYLFKISKFSNGIKAPTEQDMIIHQFTKDLDECTNVDSFNKIVNEAKFSYESGHFDINGYNILLKVCKEVIKKFQPEQPLSFQDRANKIAGEIRAKDNTPAGIVKQAN